MKMHCLIVCLFCFVLFVLVQLASIYRLYNVALTSMYIASTFWRCIDVNLFVAKFQTTFVVCFVLFLINYQLERCLYVKLKD